jgi:hypothetical protein
MSSAWSLPRACTDARVAMVTAERAGSQAAWATQQLESQSAEGDFSPIFQYHSRKLNSRQLSVCCIPRGVSSMKLPLYPVRWRSWGNWTRHLFVTLVVQLCLVASTFVWWASQVTIGPRNLFLIEQVSGCFPTMPDLVGAFCDALFVGSSARFKDSLSTARVAPIDCGTTGVLRKGPLLRGGAPAPLNLPSFEPEAGLSRSWWPWDICNNRCGERKLWLGRSPLTA